ncbi:hypothetical protein P8605_00010 [Streptomyces sp. T-3]|nr:hypothetical protein [Streptomyces sp. T-3]
MTLRKKTAAILGSVALAAIAVPMTGTAHADPVAPPASGSCSGGNITWTSTPGAPAVIPAKVKVEGFGSLTGCSSPDPRIPIKSGSITFTQDANASCVTGFAGPSKGQIVWDNKQVSYFDIPNWEIGPSGHATLSGKMAKGAFTGATFSISTTYDGFGFSNAVKCLTPAGLSSGVATINGASFTSSG